MERELKKAQDDALSAIRDREEAEGKMKMLAIELEDLIPDHEKLARENHNLKQKLAALEG